MTRIIERHPRTRDGYDTATVVHDDERVATVVTRRWHFSPAGLIGATVGAILLVMGLIGLVRGDLTGSINDPVYNVAGFAHTPLLSLLEIGAGVVLVLCGLTGWMSGMLFAGAVLVVAAVVALIETSPLSINLVIDRTYSWLILALGLVTVLAGWFMPTVGRADRRVQAGAVTDADVVERRVVDRDIR